MAEMIFNLNSNANLDFNSEISEFPTETPIGMAYVPYQKFRNLYDVEEAFPAGTLFKELDKRFLAS
jgi:hypothetical protein